MANDLVMGFDFGLSRIGVAVGQCVSKTASPLVIIKARDGIPDWSELQSLIEEWKPSLFVVGRPLNMDGTQSDMSQRAEKFARRLSGRFNIRSTSIDERLSTREARSISSAEKVDAIAAVIILETWLNSL